MKQLKNSTHLFSLGVKYFILILFFNYACGVTRVRNPKSDSPKEPDKVSINYEEKFEQLQIVSDIRQLQEEVDSRLGEQALFIFHPFISETFLNVEKETLGIIYFCDTDLPKLPDFKEKYDAIASSKNPDKQKELDIQSLANTYYENIRSYNARLESCSKEYNSNQELALAFRNEYLKVCGFKAVESPPDLNFRPIDLAMLSQKAIDSKKQLGKFQNTLENLQKSGKNDPELKDAIKQEEQKLAEIEVEESKIAEKLNDTLQPNLSQLKANADSTDCLSKISQKPAYPGRQRSGEGE